MFHIILPFVADRIRLRDGARAVIRWWLLHACKHLGLARWLLHDNIIGLDHGGGGGGDGGGGGGDAGQAEVAQQAAEAPEDHVDHAAAAENPAVAEEEIDGAAMEKRAAGREDEHRAAAGVVAARDNPVHHADAASNDSRGVVPSFSHIRVGLLVSSALLTVFALVTVALHLPLHSGRFALGVFLGAYEGHDFYSLSIGILIVWAVSTSARCAAQCIRGWGWSWQLVQAAGQWAIALAKCGLLLALMAGVAPLILGTLFEVLVVVPLRVPIDETPVLTLSQNWALGLVFLKLWVRIMVVPVQLDPFDQEELPQAAQEWQRRIDRLRQNGVLGVDFCWTMKTLVSPTLCTLADAIAIPYVAAQGIAPAFLLDSPRDRAWAKRLAVPTYLAAKAALAVLKAAWWSIVALHEHIRDERYLLGVQLNNFGP